MLPFKHGNLTSLKAPFSEVSESAHVQPPLPHCHSVTVLLQLTEKIGLQNFSDALTVRYLLFCLSLPSSTLLVGFFFKVRLVI